MKQDTHKSLKNSESQKERRRDEESKRSVPSKRTNKKNSPAPSVAKSVKSIRSPNQSAKKSPSAVSKVSENEFKPPLSPLQSDYMPTPEKQKEEPAEEQFNQYGVNDIGDIDGQSRSINDVYSEGEEAAQPEQQVRMQEDQRKLERREREKQLQEYHEQQKENTRKAYAGLLTKTAPIWECILQYS